MLAGWIDPPIMSANAAYKTWVFDCDGVLLDSNCIKSDAFFQVALPYGEAAATQFLEYHKAYGGVSRFKKFEYLFAKILKRKDYQQDLDRALSQFARYCRDGFTSCDEAPGLRLLLEKIKAGNARTYVVSGGFQDELRTVFAERGLDVFFDDIFGSPDTKDEILGREIKSGVMTLPGLFIGDSQYDFETADRHGFDFVFVSTWTEFSGWQEYFKDRTVRHALAVGDLVGLFEGASLKNL